MVFHHLQPHMAIGADGQVNDVYVRQAVDHILKACLPPEDYDSEAERYIVREIILSVLLKSVIPRVTQPWFIHKLLLDQLGPEKVVVEVPEVSLAPLFKPLSLRLHTAVGLGTRVLNLRLMYIRHVKLKNTHRFSYRRVPRPIILHQRDRCFNHR